MSTRKSDIHLPSWKSYTDTDLQIALYLGKTDSWIACQFQLSMKMGFINKNYYQAEEKVKFDQDHTLGFCWWLVFYWKPQQNKNEIGQVNNEIMTIIFLFFFFFTEVI
jgi:hypothetical protein